jgi:hypothetical protein
LCYPSDVNAERRQKRKFRMNCSIVLIVVFLIVIGALMQVGVPGIKSVKPQQSVNPLNPAATCVPSGPEKGKTEGSPRGLV